MSNVAVAKAEAKAHGDQWQHWIGGDWGHQGAMVMEVVVFYYFLLFFITRGGHHKSLTSQNIIFIGMHEDRLY
jgi:hypothetical protein